MVVNIPPYSTWKHGTNKNQNEEVRESFSKEQSVHYFIDQEV